MQLSESAQYSSARYLPRQDWAAALHDRALSEPPQIDLEKYLEAFRTHSDYYTARLKGISTWREAPLLSKTELSAISIDASEALYETRSSGTTGEQVVIKNTLSERRFRQALAYRPFLFYPVVPGTDNTLKQVIFVDGTYVDAVDKQQWPFEFGGQRYLTWRAGIAAPAEQIHALLQAVNPQIVRGLTSGIVRFVDAKHEPLERLDVQVVSPSGEQLTDEWRQSMQQAFGAPVLDRYGATETGSMAWQCPYCDAYHVNADEIIIEATPGGVVATPLYITSQPLLRYQLGDRIELCASKNCRIRLPTLTVLDARRDDWIIDGAGRKVSPLSFQFEQVAGLQAWRLHQLNTGELQLYFDAQTGADDIRPQLIQQLERTVPDRDCKLIRGLWELKRGGKFKRVTSDLSAAWL